MKVFVYGTLKKGFGNHYLLSNSKLLGDSYTKQAYDLYNLGYYPAMTDNGNYIIKGELYEVDKDTLYRLDMLEGEGYLYLRKKIEVYCNGISENCFTYIIKSKPQRYKSIEPTPRINTGLANFTKSWE